MLSESELEEARREIARREKEKSDAWQREYDARVKADNDRFEAEMNAAYPDVDADTRYSIYSDYRDFYE